MDPDASVRVDVWRRIAVFCLAIAAKPVLRREYGHKIDARSCARKRIHGVLESIRQRRGGVHQGSDALSGESGPSRVTQGLGAHDRARRHVAFSFTVIG